MRHFLHSSAHAVGERDTCRCNVTLSELYRCPARAVCSLSICLIRTQLRDGAANVLPETMVLPGQVWSAHQAPQRRGDKRVVGGACVCVTSG